MCAKIVIIDEFYSVSALLATQTVVLAKPFLYVCLSFNTVF